MKYIDVLIEKYKKEFQLGNLEWEVIYSKKDKDNTEAEIIADDKYQRITLTIYPRTLKMSKEYIKGVLIHEFCHIITQGQLDLLRDFYTGKHVTQDSIETANEKSTCLIANILIKYI
jgi:hypothetical protein